MAELQGVDFHIERDRQRKQVSQRMSCFQWGDYSRMAADWSFRH